MLGRLLRLLRPAEEEKPTVRRELVVRGGRLVEVSVPVRETRGER